MERARPPLPFAMMLLLGNLAFISAWAVVLWRPTGWLWVGLGLLAVFLALRVGGMWWHIRRFPDELGRARRTALITTVIAVLGAALWAMTALRGTA